MTRNQKLELDALHRMRRFVDHNARALGTISGAPSCVELEELVVRVEAHAADQRAAEIEMHELTQLVQARRSELRLDEIAPLVSIVNVVLRDTPRFRPFRLATLIHADDTSLMENATAMAETLAEHRQRLIDQTFRPDLIEQLHAAVEALRTVKAARKASRARLAAATRGVADELRRKQQVVPIVDALVLTALWDDAELTEAWEAARQVRPIREAA